METCIALENVIRSHFRHNNKWVGYEVWTERTMKCQHGNPYLHIWNGQNPSTNIQHYDSNLLSFELEISVLSSSYNR